MDICCHASQCTLLVFLYYFLAHSGDIILFCGCVFYMLCRNGVLNPGPKPNSCENFSVFHWNLNSISAHNFSKVSLLNAYTSLHSFDIMCLSETYWDSSILSHDPNLEVQGYDLIRADHSSNVKRGGVCIYCKNHLPLNLTNIDCLHECLTIELNIKNKLCVLVALYRSPSQSHNEFSSFITNLEST